MSRANSNYLLFMASLPKPKASVLYYKGPQNDGVFSGIQTNTGPSKYLQAVLAAEGEQFDKIIMLCTEEVENQVFENLGGVTTVDYYKGQMIGHASELGIYLDNNSFKTIPYSIAEAEKVAEILSPIMTILELAQSGQTNKRLYIDFTGGARTAAMVLLFAARYLEAQGVETANIIYANLLYGTGEDAEHPAPIEEYTKVFETFSLFAGRVEHEEAGNSQRWQEFARKYGPREQADLQRLASDASAPKK